MKVITLKPIVKNNKTTYSVETVEAATSFDQLDNIGEDLKQLNIQRFLIRKSNQNKKLTTVGKIF